MRSVVNVIVTCTKSKRAAVAPECRLRSIRPGPLRQRAREWMERLRHQTNRICVADLYSGDHWSTVRSLRSSRFDVRVWVCSAGYGLVGVEDQLSAYSATFSKNHPDSVLRDVTDAARDKVAPLWWSALSRWRGPTKKNPRTITEIAERYPNSPLLIVASETYLYALAPDVRGAVWQFADPEYLAIISAGTKSLDGLTKHLVPCDARFQSVVSGARLSLNIRLAKKILAEARTLPRLSTIRRRLQRLSETLPEIESHDRTPLSDAQVHRFIRKELRRDPSQCHTPLLRKLRQSGYACEQSRFATLYREAQEETNGR